MVHKGEREMQEQGNSDRNSICLPLPQPKHSPLPSNQVHYRGAAYRDWGYQFISFNFRFLTWLPL